MDNKNERIELPGGYVAEIAKDSPIDDWQIHKGGVWLFTIRTTEQRIKEFAAAMKPAEVSRTAEVNAAFEKIKWAGISSTKEDGSWCFVGLHCLRDYIEKLEASIAEAELRGARKMQEAAAQDCYNAAEETPDKHTEAGSFREAICLSRAECIRALNPEEVIK